MGIGARSGQANRQDVVLIHTFALQHPLQLCKCGLSRCSVAAKHLVCVGGGGGGGEGRAGMSSAFFTDGGSQLV